MNSTLQPFDPLEKSGRVVVGFGVGEADDGNFERGPSVEGVPHRHHRRSENLHGSYSARRPEQEDGGTVGRSRDEIGRAHV